MKKILLSAFAALALAMPSHAYTLDEIFGTKSITVIETTKVSLPYADDLDPVISNVTFSRIPGNDTQIRVHNLGSSNLYFTYTLIDKYGRETNDGTQLCISESELDETGNWCVMPLRYLEGSSVAGYTKSGSTVYFNISKNEFDVFEVSSQTPVYLKKMDETDNNVYHEYHNVAYLIMEPNCTFSHERYKFNWNYNNNGFNWNNPRTGPYKESYPAVLLTNYNTNRFAIYNLSNWGFAQDENYGLRLISGTINGDILEFDYDQNAKMEKFYTFSFYIGYYFANLPFVLRESEWNDDTALSTYANPTATLNMGSGLRHNNEEHGWVTNKGKRKTYDKDFVLTFNCSYTYQYLGYLNIGCPVLDDYTNVSANGDGDVTLDVELDLATLQWHSDDGVYLEGKIRTNKNDQYVDHYEVMLVKGKYDHIEQEGFEACVENGHKDAVVFCQHRNDATNHWNAPARVSAQSYLNENAGEHDYSFAKLLTPQELKHNPENGEYTAFIRAVYKPETGLTPTFHDLKYLLAPTPTEVRDLVCGDSATDVTGGVGTITVSGTDAPVQVFNAAGVAVYEGLAGTIEVGAGMYIVRAGSYTTKVLVR